MTTQDFSKEIKILNASANVDAMWGPYVSLGDAKSIVIEGLRKGGRTVGITQPDLTIKEYWWLESDITDDGLVPKTPTFQQILDDTGKGLYAEALGADIDIFYNDDYDKKLAININDEDRINYSYFFQDISKFYFGQYSPSFGSDIEIKNGICAIKQTNKSLANSANTLLIGSPTTNVQTKFTLPTSGKAAGTYTIATTNDITDSIVPASSTISGIINNTSLQELGGVDKLINGVRIGKGNNNSQYNLVLGANTLSVNTTGTENVAIGGGTLATNTTGSYNLGIGSGVLAANIVGTQNTGIGAYALYSNKGSYNTGIGTSSLQSNTTGSSNTAIGGSTLYANTTGTGNVSIGANSMIANTTGSNNVGIGRLALSGNKGGANNLAFGYNSLLANTTGSDNISIGVNAFKTNTNGSSSIAIGTDALRLYTGFNVFGNLSIGYQSLYSKSSGLSSTALGFMSLYNETTGGANVSVGARTGFAITTGEYNIIMGQGGIANAAIDNQITTGSNNILLDTNLGVNPAGITTGSNNTIVGKVGTMLSGSTSNNVVIGDGSGNRAIHKLSDNTLLAPTQEKSLITADISGKAIVTKEWFNDNVFKNLTETERLALVSPRLGLHIYQTDGVEGVYVNKSTGWVFAY